MQKCLDFRATKGKNSVPLYLEETVLASESARPTPVVDDSKNNANPSQFRRLSKGKPRALNLNAKVATSPPPDPDQSNTGGNPPESWPTARMSDAEGGRIETEKTGEGFRSYRRASQQYFGAKLRDATEMDKPKSMKLSPRWVEALMGLPIGWTDPTCSRPITPWEAVYTAASMNSEPSETE